MKKFLIVLLCIALLVPAAVLSAFADDSTLSVPFRNSMSFDIHIVLTPLDSSVPVVDVTYPASSSISWTLSYNIVYRAEVYRVGSTSTTYYPLFYRKVDVSGINFLSSNSSSPTVFDVDSDFDYFYSSSNNSSSSPVYSYFSFSSPPDPLEELGVNDGVDSSIFYTGQVLHFLATNSTTIVLIGLSVAMFAVLPFAISKIKQIIKGY